MSEDLPKPGEGREPGHSLEIEPILEWIRGAEAHLAALQADHERVSLLYERQTAQLDRMLARIAALEARIRDLDRADTEIAVTLSHLQIENPRR